MAELKKTTSGLFLDVPEPQLEEYILAHDGLKLLYKRYAPLQSGPPSCSVILIHGFGEHSGRFRHVVSSLLATGAMVHAMDLRGHGLSGGARADGNFGDFLSDIAELHRRVSPDRPVFIYGHSMGGMLVLAYTLHLRTTPGPRRLDGVIATSPWLRLSGRLQPMWWKEWALRLSGSVFDEVLVSSNVDPCSLSSREVVVSEAINDRLVIPFLTVRLAKQLLGNSSALMRRAEDFVEPLLIIHGGSDKLTSHLASIEFVERCRSADKTCKIFDNAMHEIHNDKDAPELLAEINRWIVARCSGSGHRGEGVNVSDAHREFLAQVIARRSRGGWWMSFARFVALAAVLVGIIGWLRRKRLVRSFANHQ